MLLELFLAGYALLYNIEKMIVRKGLGGISIAKSYNVEIKSIGG